jgi:hypothetical protein
MFPHWQHGDKSETTITKSPPFDQNQTKNTDWPDQAAKKHRRHRGKPQPEHPG